MPLRHALVADEVQGIRILHNIVRRSTEYVIKYLDKALCKNKRSNARIPFFIV